MSALKYASLAERKQIEDWDSIIHASLELVKATEISREDTLKEIKARHFLSQSEKTHYFLKSEYDKTKHPSLDAVFEPIEITLTGYEAHCRFDKDHECNMEDTVQFHRSEKRPVEVDEYMHDCENLTFDLDELEEAADRVVKAKRNYNCKDADSSFDGEIEFGDWDDPAVRVSPAFINLVALVPKSKLPPVDEE